MPWTILLISSSMMINCLLHSLGVATVHITLPWHDRLVPSGHRSGDDWLLTHEACYPESSAHNTKILTYNVDLGAILWTQASCVVDTHDPETRERPLCLGYWCYMVLNAPSWSLCLQSQQASSLEIQITWFRTISWYPQWLLWHIIRWCRLNVLTLITR